MSTSEKPAWEDEARDAIETELRRTSVEVPVALEVPSREAVLSAIQSNQKVRVVIVGPLRLSRAVEADAGMIEVSGVASVVELEVTCNQFTVHEDGYSFIGVHHTFHTWEYNYNAGRGREDVWVTYKFTVNNKSSRATYEQLDRKRKEGRV